MLLSAPAILRHLKQKTIVIDPFNPKNLGNASYDVTLGRYYYREQKPKEKKPVFDIYNEADTYRVWGTKHYEAKIHKGHPTIWLAPGETILAHTEEFIGGVDIVDTMLKARSSTARNFISICKCAGWGDVGYVNRWTMQITNHSRYYHIPLVAGRRIAQMIFFEVESLDQSRETKPRTDPTAVGSGARVEHHNVHNAGAYHKKEDSKYQTTIDLKKLKKEWNPSDMLPKMWRDRDVKKSQ